MTEKRKKRRQFGTVLLRRNPSGKTQTWIGRYTYKGVRCQRSFGKDGRIQAQSWLEEEKLLVDLDRRDIQRWVPWSERRRKEMTSHLTFDQWADHYINTHRRKDGQPLTGSSKRNLRADAAHSTGSRPQIMASPAGRRRDLEDAIYRNACIHADRGLPGRDGRRAENRRTVRIAT